MRVLKKKQKIEAFLWVLLGGEHFFIPLSLLLT